MNSLQFKDVPNLSEDVEEETAVQPTIPLWLWRQPWLLRHPGKKTRAGFTKNHGKGMSKARRKLVKASRRRNRGKR